MKSATSKSIRPVTPTHKRSFDPEDRIFRYTLKNRQAKSIVIHSPDSHKTDSIAKEGEIHSPMFKRSKSNGPLDCTDKNNKSRERRRWNEEAYIE